VKNLLLFILILQSIVCNSAFGLTKSPTDSIAKAKNGKSKLVYFEGNFTQALQKARLENKMIFIDSYTTWCGPCKQMKSLLVSDAKLIEFLNQNFVCLSINIEKGDGPRIKRKYPHGTFPTLLFIKNDGKLKNRFVGLPNYGSTELLNFARLTLRR
jgi:thioredoxin 1